MSDSTLWLAAGWTMLHSLWIGGAIGALAALVRFALRRAQPSWRHGVSCAALVALAVLPALLFSIAPDASGPAKGAVLVAAPLGAALPSPGWTQAWIERLPWLWAIGTPLYTIWLFHGLFGTSRLRRRARRAPEREALARCCASLARQLGVARRVAVRVCDEVAGPVLVGVFKPLIVLPTAVVNGCSPEQIEMVLLHELAHVRRWDNLVQLLQRSVQAALFFHPAVWLVSRWIDLEREHCCDAVVLEHTRRPRAYAETLLALAEAKQGALALSLSMARKPLITRIQRILEPQEPTGMQGRTASLVISATLGAASIGLVPLANAGGHDEPHSSDSPTTWTPVQWVPTTLGAEAHPGIPPGTDCSACHAPPEPEVAAAQDATGCPFSAMAHPHGGQASEASCTDCHVAGTVSSLAPQSSKLQELIQRERELRRLQQAVVRLRREIEALRSSSPGSARKAEGVWSTLPPQWPTPKAKQLDLTTPKAKQLDLTTTPPGRYRINSTPPVRRRAGDDESAPTHVRYWSTTVKKPKVFYQWSTQAPKAAPAPNGTWVIGAYGDDEDPPQTFYYRNYDPGAPAETEDATPRTNTFFYRDETSAEESDEAPATRFRATPGRAQSFLFSWPQAGSHDSPAGDPQAVPRSVPILSNIPILGDQFVETSAPKACDPGCAEKVADAPVERLLN